MSKPIPTIVERDTAQAEAAVRAAYSALREAEVQEQKAVERAENARRITGQRRRELGRALVEARKLWPARGPRAKGWGEFLAREGIEQSTAWRLMQEAGYREGEDDTAPTSEPRISCSAERLHEIPHPAENPGAPAAPPAPERKPLGLLADLPILLGRWEDVLSVDEIGVVDAIITDPPYSARTHESKPTRNDGVDASGLAPNYAAWGPEDVDAFVAAWSPRCRGWMVCLCDSELIPVYKAAYERHGRYAFAPVPCVITGMSVRTRGDGPSSWAVYAMVARPRTAAFVNWGTLPGAYVGGREDGAEHGRGKPRWLTDALVRDYTRPNDLVCDPLAGYGTTLISALLQRRRAIGAEIDEAAVNEAIARANALNESAE